MPEECIQQLDGVSFRLAAPFDFGFLHRYGTVFKVFDDQDSGNICFGVKASDRRRYFVKYAGASPIQYRGTRDSSPGRCPNTSSVASDCRWLRLRAIPEPLNPPGGGSPPTRALLRRGVGSVLQRMRRGCPW